ncbi:MAG: hypothetical protein ABI354_00390 [Candidatus Saccharimonadales bacterium]
MKLFVQNKTVSLRLYPLLVTGIAAIVGGGVMSAAAARHPSYLSSWAVAYAVLVIGVVQILIAVSVEHLAVAKISRRLVWTLFVLFNSGNAAVLIGTAQKYNSGNNNFVYVGGGAIAVAMLIAIYSVRHAKASWALIMYYVVVVIVMASMTIGMALSSS